MKLLYLDLDAQYINPTTSLMPLLMSCACPDIRLYGPGYVAPNELAQGVRRWIDRNGPFDAVMLGPLIPFFEPGNSVRGAEFVCRFTVQSGSCLTDLVRYFDDVIASIAALPIPVKIVTSLALDTYASTNAQVDRVLAAGLMILGHNRQFVSRMAEWQDGALDREKHYRRKRSRLSDAWLDFLESYPERVLTACHYVGDHEFCLTALAHRRWDIAVPGVQYRQRHEALASLKSARLRVASRAPFHAFRAANRLGLPVFSHRLTARFYNLLFQQTLFGSRMVFTAPAGSGHIIRKFFEIPAAGAVLVCTRCTGFDAVGFEDGVNCLMIEPAELARIVESRRDDEALQRVADAGRQLVMTRHSLRARAGQIARCLESVRAGTYRGADWHKGEFFVSEAGGQASRAGALTHSSTA